VGQGDGIWIHTWDDGDKSNHAFDGRNIVIDGGPDGSDSKNEFLKYLRAHLGAQAKIDALIITHPHNDHYPGARGVVRHFPVCSYYDPDTPNGQDFDHFLTEVKGAHCDDGSPIVLHRGFTNLGAPDWGHELKVEFLYGGPVEHHGMGSGNSLVNNSSIVMKLTYGTQSFLFMGDAEGKERSDSPDTPKYAEARMLGDSATAAKLHATVIKLAHHGSETSSSLPFIRAVDPEVVVVSSGRKSFSGTFLPDRTTLQRYCDHNPQIRIYSTDEGDAAEGRTTANDADGDHVVIRTNGVRTEVVAMKHGEPLPPATSCVP
jgi:beta-lactamase superfamily II metal-dependent hydrolase